MNEAQGKLNLLKQLIEADLNAATQAGVALKKKANWFKFLTITLSALVTVLLGINFGADLAERAKALALIFSTAVTSFSTWESFANYLQRSNQESINVNRLYMLYKDILLYLQGKAENGILEEDYLGFKKQYDLIHEEYLQDRKSLNEKEDIKKSDSEN